MFARGSLHLVALATLLLGAGVGVGDEGSGAARPHGLPATGSPVPGSAGTAGGTKVGDSDADRTVTVVPAERLREGTTLRLKGRFDLVADQVSFYPEDSDATFRTLENLALERVVRTVRESTVSRLWTVEAEVTEFQGANYLLIRRATVSIGE